jgi:phosphopantothenoylcysteine synthetase/decarboxylase
MPYNVNMKILVTAGNTRVPIDRVRCITNIFTGKTGAAIAILAHKRGHDVTLLTSHPEALPGLNAIHGCPSWALHVYRTFDELQSWMADAIVREQPDAVIHSAAVSDYHVAGVFSVAPGSVFDPRTATWQTTKNNPPTFRDRSAGKVKSDEPELWLRLVRTPKLIDLVRNEWRHAGLLVKFKLEVGVSQTVLEEIAERSRVQSAADWIVANTLEGAAEWAILGPVQGSYQRVARSELASRLLTILETNHGKRHG